MRRIVIGFDGSANAQRAVDFVGRRLLTFPNVLITSHQAFLTREALANIASTTRANVTAFERGEPLANEVRAAAGWIPPLAPAREANR